MDQDKITNIQDTNRLLPEIDSDSHKDERSDRSQDSKNAPEGEVFTITVFQSSHKVELQNLVYNFLIKDLGKADPVPAQEDSPKVDPDSSRLDTSQQSNISSPISAQPPEQTFTPQSTSEKLNLNKPMQRSSVPLKRIKLDRMLAFNKSRNTVSFAKLNLNIERTEAKLKPLKKGVVRRPKIPFKERLIIKKQNPLVSPYASTWGKNILKMYFESSKKPLRRRIIK